jgi:hypothetical protein
MINITETKKKINYHLIECCFNYMSMPDLENIKQGMTNITQYTKKNKMKELLQESLNNQINNIQKKTLEGIKEIHDHFNNSNKNQNFNENSKNLPQIKAENNIAEFYYSNQNTQIDYNNKHQTIKQLLFSFTIELLKQSLSEEYNKSSVNNIKNCNQSIIFYMMQIITPNSKVVFKTNKLNNNYEENAIVEEYLNFLNNINGLKDFLNPTSLLEKQINNLEKRYEAIGCLLGNVNLFDCNSNKPVHLNVFNFDSKDLFQISKISREIFDKTRHLLKIINKNFESLKHFEATIKKTKNFSSIKNNHESYMKNLIESINSFRLYMLFMKHNIDLLVKNFNIKEAEIVKGILEEMRKYQSMFDKCNTCYILMHENNKKVKPNKFLDEKKYIPSNNYKTSPNFLNERIKEKFEKNSENPTTLLGKKTNREQKR